MSVQHDQGAPISADSALARALDSMSVPPLPNDFADRVTTRAGAEAQALTQNGAARSSVSARSKERGRIPAFARWRAPHRLMAATLGIGALASAAAATGVLGNLPANVPEVEQVWRDITGEQPVAAMPSGPDPAALIDEQIEPETSGSTKIIGAIDTREELEEAFTRIDALRKERIALRRERIDRRRSFLLEERRKAGGTAPDTQNEARIEEAIEAQRERRDANRRALRDARRAMLRERLEEGDELPITEAFGNAPLMSEDRAERRALRRERLREWRSMKPEARRERLRQLRESRFGEDTSRNLAGAQPEPDTDAPSQEADTAVSAEPSSDETEKNSIGAKD